MNKIIILIACFFLYSDLHAQSNDALDQLANQLHEQKEAAEPQKSYKHTIGISLTSIGPLELNYEFQFRDKLSFKLGYIPTSSNIFNPSLILNAGLRYQLFSKEKFDFYSGIDYSFERYYIDSPKFLELFVSDQPFEYLGHNIEIPLGVKYNINERSALDFGVTSKYIISAKNSVNSDFSQNKFKLVSRFRLGYQYKF